MTAKHPFFSIIIPTYDSEETLAIALQSIASQTFKNVEAIIQDGLSNDKTLEIAHSFKDRISLVTIVSEKDFGIYDAMNKAMRRATGQWIIFLGSDDSFYNSEVLQKTANFIDNTDYAVVYGNAKIIGDTGWAKDGEIYAGLFTTEKLLAQNICHQAMFYNRAFLEREIGGFNERYTKSSDWDYNLKCWAKRPFGYMDFVVANFLSGGFSTNSTDHTIVEDFVDNVLTYFAISPFDRLVNTPTFMYYNKVVAKQKELYPLRYKIVQLKKRLIKKISR